MRTLLILLLAAAPASPQEEAVFRAGASLVKVDVQVTDGERAVQDLDKDDFVVKDEGIPQKIVHFGREAEPLRVALLLDVSGSMKKHVKRMAEASREALAALRPGDECAIALFSRSTAVHQEFTAEFPLIEKGLDRALAERGLGSATLINSAVIETANYLNDALRGKAGRRSIVILTDNRGLNYQTPNEDVIRALHGADAVLNAIAVGGASPPAPLRPDANPDFTPSDVFLLARETGGEVIKAKDAGSAFQRILAGIRNRYSLHYVPPEGRPGEYRTITVELTPAARERRRRAEVSARRGYYR